MISITLNGKPRQLERETPLPELLRQLDINVRLIAVAINGEVVPKRTYEAVTVRDADTVEIVRMVGGGSRTLIQQAKGALCRIECGDIGSSGSGFFVEPDILVTCDHVVSHEVVTPRGLITREFSKQISIGDTTGRFTGEVISSRTGTEPYFYDYAILRAAGRNGPFLQLADHTAIAAGDDVLVLGYPLGSDHLVATRAMVASKVRIPSHRNQIVSLDVVELDGSVNVGNSGGPAISQESGEVVGIVSVRYGSIGKLLDAYRAKLSGSMPPWLSELLEILEESNNYLNPGIGFAVSCQYVRDELRRLAL